MKNKTNMFYCLTCLIGLTLPVTAQTQYDDLIAAYPAPSFAADDFRAISSSVCKAAATNWSGALEWNNYIPNAEIEQIRFLFDLMGIISTSKVSVICHKSSGANANEGNLSFWITDDAVYKIHHPVMPFFNKYSLSLSKSPRTSAFDSELIAFEVISLQEGWIGGHNAPRGFYVKRMPDGTFESVFFHQLPPGSLANPKDRKMEFDLKQPQKNPAVPIKVSTFNHLLKTFDELMEKPVVWSDDGTPRTRTE